MATVEQILNTDVPKPTFSLSPSRQAPLPSEVKFGETNDTGRSSSRRTLDPVSGKYVSKASDVPRIYGADQSLVVQRKSAKNFATNSADPIQWGYFGVTEVGSRTSLIDGGNSYAYSSNSDNWIFKDVGTTTGNDEVAQFIFEEETATKVKLHVRGEVAAYAVYEFGQGIISTSGTDVVQANARVLEENGPNNGRVVILVIQYNGTAGDDRQLAFEPDETDSGNATIFHHGQLQEDSRAAAPVVTRGSVTTRAAEFVEIKDTSFMKSNEGTFLFEIQPRAYDAGFDRIFGNIIFSGIGTYRYDNSQGSNTDLSSNLNGPFKVDRLAVSGDQSEWLSSCNGQTGATKSDPFGVPTLSTIVIGGNTPVGYSRVVYYPRKLSQSTLNILTS